MKKCTLEFTEHDIVYMLNCICLTKDILKLGQPQYFEHYFRKEMFNTYMYDLTLMQRLMGYKANKIFYNFSDYDYFIGQGDYLYLSYREFHHLFGKEREQRLKEIEREKKYRENLFKFNEIPKKLKFFKNFWNFKKEA